jgi:hypothetical protein
VVYFKRHLGNIILIVFMISLISKPSDAHANGENDISVSLRIQNQEIEVGKLPKLTVKIKNVSEIKIKVLNIEGRPDLQDTYCESIFLKNGNHFKYMTAISDPGPVGDRDFVKLSPGEELSINLANPNIDPNDLKPGKYEVYVIFRPDPYSFAKKYRSQKVGFIVKK